MLSWSKQKINIVTHRKDHKLYSLYIVSKYSETSKGQTSLGPWKYVLDMVSLSYCGLVVAPGQDANRDTLGVPYRSFI